MQDFLQGHMMPYLANTIKDKRTAFRVALALGPTVIASYPVHWKPPKLKVGVIMRIREIRKPKPHFIKNNHMIKIVGGDGTHEAFFGNWGRIFKLTRRRVYIQLIDEVVDQVFDKQKKQYDKKTSPVLPPRIVEFKTHRFIYKHPFQNILTRVDTNSMLTWERHVTAQPDEMYNPVPN